MNTVTIVLLKQFDRICKTRIQKLWLWMIETFFREVTLPSLDNSFPNVLKDCQKSVFK
jgi:hypothetical protein